jgi:hypothetical protein
LEGHRENALKLGMYHEAKKLEKHKMGIRHIKDDFNAGVALNLERLAADIEAEDMQVAKQMAR